jgi:hypothetical protein
MEGFLLQQNDDFNPLGIITVILVINLKSTVEIHTDIFSVFYYVDCAAIQCAKKSIVAF